MCRGGGGGLGDGAYVSRRGLASAWVCGIGGGLGGAGRPDGWSVTRSWCRRFAGGADRDRHGGVRSVRLRVPWEPRPPEVGWRCFLGLLHTGPAGAGVSRREAWHIRARAGANARAGVAGGRMGCFGTARCP